MAIRTKKKSHDKDVAVKADTRPTVPWQPWIGVAFIIGLFFIAQFAAAIIVSLYPALSGWSQNRTVNWLTESIAAQFVLMILVGGITLTVIYWFLQRYKTSWTVIGLCRPRWRDFGFTLLAAPVYYVIYVLSVGVLSQLISGFNIEQEQQIGFENARGVIALAMTFISLVIIPPIIEEIMMRGVIYSSLRKAYSFIAAAIATSFIFAIAHLQLGQGAAPLYIAAVDTFILSLVLVYLREKTGSLWAGIGLHALKNCVAFVALFILHVGQ